MFNAMAEAYASFALGAYEDRITFEQQGHSSGTSSDVPAWAAVSVGWPDGWPCTIKPARDTQGSREVQEGGLAAAKAYEIRGPAMSEDASAAIDVKREWRMRIAASARQPERLFMIIDSAPPQGVEVRILARRAQ